MFSFEQTFVFDSFQEYTLSNNGSITFALFNDIFTYVFEKYNNEKCAVNFNLDSNNVPYIYVQFPYGKAQALVTSIVEDINSQWNV